MVELDIVNCYCEHMKNTVSLPLNLRDAKVTLNYVPEHHCFSLQTVLFAKCRIYHPNTDALL